MNIKQKLMKWFRDYQRAMFYSGQAAGEIGKPLRFITELGVVLLLLSDSGIRTTLTVKISVYVVLIMLTIVAGRFLVQLGIVKYVTKLSNKENPEITEILEKVREMWTALKNE